MALAHFLTGKLFLTLSETIIHAVYLMPMPADKIPLVTKEHGVIGDKKPLLGPGGSACEANYGSRDADYTNLHLQELPQ